LTINLKLWTRLMTRTKNQQIREFKN